LLVAVILFPHILQRVRSGATLLLLFFPFPFSHFLHDGDYTNFRRNVSYQHMNNANAR
jgi:hypothetical protein